MKRKFTTLAVAFLATIALATAQNPSTTVTLSNGARLTFSTWTWQGVTNASLDDAEDTDGKIINIPSTVTIAGTQYDVTMIGAYSFMNQGLTEVVIPDVCTDIYYGAFDGCTSLTTVTIGTGVSELADGAFLGCSALTTLYFNAANATTDDSYGFGGVFGDCDALTTIHFGPHVQSLDDDIFFSLNATATLSTITIAAERLLGISSSNFFGYGQSGVSITVPCSQLAAYQANSAWSALGTITADCGGPTTHTLTVASNDPTMGSAWGSCSFLNDTTTLIYATPSAGHAFQGWSDGNSNNPRNITVDTDSTVTALFFLPGNTLCDSTIYDTLTTLDTLTVTAYDTIPIYDTILVTAYDTVTLYDTVHITVYDTIVTSLETIGSAPVKVYLSGSRLVVEGTQTGEAVKIYDMQGRQHLSLEARGPLTKTALPPAGAYLVRVGNRPARKIIVRN